MVRFGHRRVGYAMGASAWLLSAAISLVAVHVHGAVIQLKNGTEFEGRVGKISSLLQNPNQSQGGREGVDVRLIVVVNNNLTRTFFSTLQVQQIRESEPVSVERIKIHQRVAESGQQVGGVGTIIRVTDWDKWGRRIFSMLVKGRGQVDVIQGITEITPEWTKVEGLQGIRAIKWDMRIATSSIPREKLTAILMGQIDPKKPDDRLRLVRLYLQAERYSDARAELESAVRDFPELHELKEQVQALRQLNAQQLIGEIELRRKAGQHSLVLHLLRGFPDEGIAGETLLKVRQMLDEYGRLEDRGKRVSAMLDRHLAAVKDDTLPGRLQPVVNEIKSHLNIHNLDRMADYLRLADDDKLETEQKLSLAVSGWLSGSGAGQENLQISLSLFEIRNLVRDYLRAARKHERDEILEKMKSLEGGSPSYVARLVAHMLPPQEMPEATEGDPEGLYRVSVPGLTGGAPIDYVVQLPPQYDPYRRYPTIVALHSAGTTPLQEIDWWAGSYSPEAKMRLGQATRRGYVVVAPRWTRQHQASYEFTAREHAAVLFSLRDACRKFSIDTDHVFLSGHSAGGDAAWDIGLSHPDVWAGVIPVVATADKYIVRYWENARQVPLYFVMGELDGNKLTLNVRDLDRYLTKKDFDTTVVEYLGRGHEHFLEEIHRIFQWMDVHERDFSPSRFKCFAMRPWDNYFWWVELDQFPLRSVVVPEHWPPKAGVRPVMVGGEIQQNNHLRVQTGAGLSTIWLSPDVVDFEKKLTITLNGRNHVNPESAVPELSVLLEDVRTRSDRQHPFWAKFQLRTGRGRR